MHDLAVVPTNHTVARAPTVAAKGRVQVRVACGKQVPTDYQPVTFPWALG